MIKRVPPTLAGLTAGSHLRPQVLGTRGSRMCVDTTHVRVRVDPGTQLVLFPLQDVFVAPSVFLGFGTPNAYLAFPADGVTWQKFSAFMFWRTPSFVAATKGRVQAGILFEMPQLPAAAVAQITTAAAAHSGRRSVTCARACAHVLASAGFTSGGRSLRRHVRPSRLGARLWESGLEWRGEPVDLRVIQTARSPSDHFTSVWKKELFMCAGSSASAPPHRSPTGSDLRRLHPRCRHVVPDDADVDRASPGRAHSARTCRSRSVSSRSSDSRSGIRSTILR